MTDVISIILSALAFALSLFTFISSTWNERKRNTIDEYIDMQNDLYQFYQYGKDEIEDFLDDRECEEYKALSSCLARIEFFATGINRKVYDFGTAYDLSHGYLDKALRSRIEYMLKMKNEYAKDSEVFYQNTQKLFARMDKKSRKGRK